MRLLEGVLTPLHRLHHRRRAPALSRVKRIRHPHLQMVKNTKEMWNKRSTSSSVSYTPSRLSG